MMIEVKGIHFANQGAVLMLMATLQRLRQAFPQARFVIEPRAPYPDRARFGLYQKLWGKRLGIEIGTLGGMVPNSVRNKFGVVVDAEVDTILDLSGFAYSDSWGPAKIKNRMANHIGQWKRQGKQVILLPQALGPFENAAVREAFGAIVEHADLIFARDPQSLAYVEGAYGKRDNVKLGPDFSAIVSGYLPADRDRFRGRSCLIPNIRMMDKTSGDLSGRYVEEMAGALARMDKEGTRPFVLVHEGAEDYELAEKIVAASGTGTEIVHETDPLITKGILGTTAFLVGSRFHGLVNALCQGVPVLGIGWSHKYRMLLRDYDSEDLLVDPNKPAAGSLAAMLDPLLDADERGRRQARIVEAGRVQKDAIEAMWQEVIDRLKASSVDRRLSA
ncbi:polysaccharide pyruvyl transferase family protein [Marinivivus vitaminiproducens]|uniref:polysaccharide pyruvyl transferase family protein n=1 Tax=Marinivivus vitaminiproducens TaxID=3035935 RepID=UPI0027A2E0B1|nr:polysaccharide pyruvyl transferase family protein [Geminicoccaceae bacterium SCSIO 64248]